jgi:hypothetical protein
MDQSFSHPETIENTSNSFFNTAWSPWSSHAMAILTAARFYPCFDAGFSFALGGLDHIHTFGFRLGGMKKIMIKGLPSAHIPVFELSKCYF